MRASAWGVAALVLGIVGTLLGWLPVVGRFAALGCGVLAAALGAVGMRRAAYGVRGSGYNLAVAGLALGCASVFAGLRGFATLAVTSAVFNMIG